MSAHAIDPMTRFLAKIMIGDGCWQWTARKRSKGYPYGFLQVGKVGNYYAHRFSYEQFVGPIPDGSVVRHFCGNHSCVRPDHLFVKPEDEHVKTLYRKAARRLRESDPVKYQARLLYNYALQKKQVKRSNSCAYCHKTCKPDGHHIDYAKPYCVVWLCRPCHGLAGSGEIEVGHLAIDYTENV